MRTSEQGKKFIAQREGIETKAYLDSSGYLTVGVGHLVLPNEPYKLGQSISLEEVYDLLTKDLIKTEQAVNSSVTIGLQQNQFDALVSLVFNIGQGQFKRSTVLKRLNANNISGAASAILLFDRARNPKTGKTSVVPGLVRRRQAEKAQFLTPYPEVQEVKVPRPAEVPTVVPEPVAPVQPAANAPAESRDLSKMADAYVDGFLHVSDQAAEIQERVSKSSWFKALLVKILGIICLAVSYLMDNWEIAVPAVALIGFGIWYLTYLRKKNK